MKLSFTRRPQYYGNTHTSRELSVQFFEDHNGKDMLKVRDNFQCIYVPVSLINKALEDQWARDSAERAERVKSESA